MKEQKSGSDKQNLWLLGGGLFLAISGLIALFYGFGRGIGGPIERNFDLRLLVGCSWLALGLLVLKLYSDVRKRRK